MNGLDHITNVFVWLIILEIGLIILVWIDLIIRAKKRRKRKTKGDGENYGKK